MNGAVSVDVDALRGAATRLLDVVAARYGDVVDVPLDLYWKVDVGAAFDVYVSPGDRVVIGQLSDDDAEVRSALDREHDDEIVLWHDLSHLAGVITALAAIDLPSAD